MWLIPPKRDSSGTSTNSRWSRGVPNATPAPATASRPNEMLSRRLRWSSPATASGSVTTPA